MTFALGAALHFDFELAADPRPFEVLVEAVMPPGGELRHWFIYVENRKAPPGVPLDLRKLAGAITRGGLATAAVETAPKTDDAARLLVTAGTTPVAKRPERFSQTRCRYGAVVVVGADRLRELGVDRALAAIVAFADAVGVRAGVIHRADSAAYAEGLASCGGSTSLTREQIGKITDRMYWQPRWGQAIRGPEWGTFLGAAHVDRLGGLAQIRTAAARVVELGSGGALVEATPFDDADDGAAIARLAELLAPVMGSAVTGSER